MARGCAVRFPSRGAKRLHGFVHPSYAGLVKTLEAQIAGSPGGAAVCVYQQGECVADLWGGERDAAGTPWDSETMAVSFSTTKGVASTALHVVADKGLVDYDAPVAKYWPEFAQEGKRHITVADVLRHQAGLYDVRSLVDAAHRIMDWDYMVDALAKARPADDPQHHTAYHALTYGHLVGEIIRRVTGLSFPEFLQREIATPLKLDGFFVGAPSHEHDRAASFIDKELIPDVARGPRKRTIASRLRPQRLLMQTEVAQRIRMALMPRGISGIDFCSKEMMSASIPAANGLFTARSLARMYATLAGDGSLDGARLLSETTLDRLSRRQSVGKDRVIPLRMGWRLGYHNVVTTMGTPRNAFGHYGFGGSGAWACRTRNLAFAMVLNGGISSPLANYRTLRVSGAVLGCASAYGRAEGHVTEAPGQSETVSRLRTVA